MIEIVVNGNNRQMPPDASIANLISQLKVKPQVCVVEVNGEIVSRDEYCARYFKHGDQIEIIRFMAGG